MSRLRQALLDRRERYNTAFALARRVRPRLSEEAFKEHLLTVVAPIVEATAPRAAEAVTEALYDASLELVGSGLFSRYEALREGWIRLPQLAPHLEREPRRLVAAFSNALHRLSVTPGARAHQWLEELLEAAPLCGDTERLLEAGKVLGWKAGLAHYREGALQAAAALPARLAAHLLEADDPADRLARLRDDPWLCPEGSPLEVVARVGAFRGFGGLFLRPPRAHQEGDDLVVSDGDGAWLVTADLYGATFHPTPLPQGDPRSTLPGRLKKLVAEPTSWAANRHTAAVTSRFSHAVTLIALRGERL